MKLILGTVQFGLAYGVSNRKGQVGIKDAKAILDIAFAHGIDTLDTAIAYGDSESRLGELGVGGWNVITKLPMLPEGTSDIGQWVREQVNGSLARLRLERIHCLLLHKPDQLLGPGGDELYSTIQQLKRDGVVDKIGVSVYQPCELEALLKGRHFDVVQTPFNVLDRRLVEFGWLKELKVKQIEVHARSIFLQGLLLMNSADRPARFDRWGDIFAKWDLWLREQNVSSLSACIGHALTFSDIDKLVVGVESVEHLKMIIKATRDHPDRGLEAPVDIISNDVDLINPGRW